MKKQDAIIIFVIGTIGFGATMALHDVMSDIWLRAVVASIAFVILGFTISRFPGRNNKKKTVE